jgi:hypothetical protein
MGIKFIDPKLTIKVVSISDSAIDKQNSDMVKYQETYDTSFLKFLETETPTFFVIANVGSAELVSIQQDHYVTELPKIEPGQTQEELKNMKVKVSVVRQGEMLLKYFKAGCKKIIDRNKEIEVTDDVMNTIPPMALQELGSFIMSRSILDESKKK